MKLAFGIFLLVCMILGIYIFSPVLKSEIEYSFDRSLGVRYVPGQGETLNSFEKQLPIPNTDASIVIPKIGVAEEVKNLPNPFEQRDLTLTFGDELYLINKLQKGDRILLYYQGRVLTYEVGESDPTPFVNRLTIEVEYLPNPFIQTIDVSATSLLTNN